MSKSAVKKGSRRCNSAVKLPEPLSNREKHAGGSDGHDVLGDSGNGRRSDRMRVSRRECVEMDRGEEIGEATHFGDYLSGRRGSEAEDYDMRPEQREMACKGWYSSGERFRDAFEDTVSSGYNRTKETRRDGLFQAALPSSTSSNFDEDDLASQLLSIVPNADEDERISSRAGSLRRGMSQDRSLLFGHASREEGREGKKGLFSGYRLSDSSPAFAPARGRKRASLVSSTFAPAWIEDAAMRSGWEELLSSAEVNSPSYGPDSATCPAGRDGTYQQGQEAWPQPIQETGQHSGQASHSGSSCGYPSP